MSEAVHNQPKPATEVMHLLEFFKSYEYPPNVLQHLRGDVLLAKDKVRRIHGSAISPSPIRGAHVRVHGSVTSRHYIGNGRLSDATDFFPHGNAQNCFLACMSVEEIGGIGIYLDTFNGNIRHGLVPMFHIDLRPRQASGSRTFWMRLKDGTMINPHSNNGSMKRFFEELTFLAEN